MKKTSDDDIFVNPDKPQETSFLISADKITAGTISADKINFNPLGKWLAITKGEWALAEPKKDHPTNCVNCGAALHGNVCEYCGTEY